MLQPERQNESAIGLLRVLLAASLIIPLLLFIGLSIVNYRSVVKDAIRDLERVGEVGREHASRTFDRQNQVVERVKDLVHGMTVDQIKADQRQLHEALASIVGHLPQIQSVLLISGTGQPLASASIYPVAADTDLSGTDFVSAVIKDHSPLYISKLQVGAVLKRQFFGLAGPLVDASGAIKGVIDVAVSPEFFRDFYRALIDGSGGHNDATVLTLLRDDGQILVRYPAFQGQPPKVGENSPFFTAIRDSPSSGSYFGYSVIDRNSPARLYVFHKVEGYPLYVVAGRSWYSIISGWYWTVAGYLLVGIPTTAALYAITRTALIRTQQEATALARANQEMRARQLAEEALLRAQRLEAVGQLTGGVAHDFNNLLTVILGNVDLMDKRFSDAALRRLVNGIRIAAKRGAEITQKLLAFSGRQMIQPETVNLNTRLLDFKSLLDRAASEAVQVRLDLTDQDASVHLDPGQFEAAILNLVGNARDALASGGRIAIMTRNINLGGDEIPGLRPGPYVVTSVEDNGSGMNTDTAAKAFEPFFTTKEVGKGTGLGLSQVYGFARQAGGTVRIITAPGQGTTVELILPRARALPDVTPAAAAAIPGQDITQGEVILVVEDEPNVRDMAVENLQGLGYRTMTAPNAHEALQQLRTSDGVNVLFSDIVMPGGMNGVELAIQARCLRPDLKILLTSGYTGTTIRRDLPDNVPLLTKPYDSVQLAQYMQFVLHGHPVTPRQSAARNA